ncbi:2-dehydro-3-deoxygalactonokinase [Roseovarius sp. M141]|uniref:2-dehydro-3-deoxygalactonokinase n=1 Tax=Roseovarius sp. M141 TaxID=2583806 RepID=UPI0020CCC826|nr:2-dehydro-3-deoxygalactonokinase [Roseovarius sp. M141]MCQ0091070.1 2-dehydro-3-deoxygalactonokinase [Roseovarius sp. M141]
MDQPWGVLSEEGGRVTLHEFQGDRLRTRDFATIEAAQTGSGVPAGRLVGLKAAPDAEVPAPILPTAPGALGAVRQRAPYGLVPAAARILIAGALAERPDWDGIICLPGAGQTLWVHVSAREIVSFQGAATHRLAAAFGAGGGPMDRDALGDTLARPERLAVQLQSASLMGDTAAIIGHLIGAELAAMRPFWLGQQVVIVGGAMPYGAALAEQGVQAEAVTQMLAWRAGLAALGRAVGLVE